MQYKKRCLPVTSVGGRELHAALHDLMCLLRGPGPVVVALEHAGRTPHCTRRA